MGVPRWAALDGQLEGQFTELIEAIRVVRNLRAVAGLKPAQHAPVVFGTERSAQASPSSRALAGVSGELQVMLPQEGLVDIAALMGRLEKDLAKADREIQGLAGRLAYPNFAEKAPPELVAECQAYPRSAWWGDAPSFLTGRGIFQRH